MKKVFVKLLGLAFAMAVLFSSCQQESVEIVDNQNDQNLTANVAQLLANVATNDGSADNIVDNASCVEITLPITVIVNGLEIIIDSEEDLEIIEAIFEEFDDDDDTLEIIFPITIVLADFTEIVINNLEELEQYTDDCFGDNEPDDDIECIDFVYPITFSVFDSDDVLIDTVTINDDEALYDFIDDLDSDDVVSLNFPVQVVLADGNVQTINTQDELEAAIEAAEDACDEDDDNDDDDDDNVDQTEEELAILMTECLWAVDELEIDDDDLEDQYDGYLFDFNEDFTVTASTDSDEFLGTWEITTVGDNLRLFIEIDGLPDFTNNWIVHEIEDEDELVIELRLGEDVLSFEQDCDSDDDDDDDDITEEEVDEALQECIWIGIPNGNDDFNIYEFAFNDAQELIVTNTNTSDTFGGNWITSQNDDGDIVVTISNLTGDLTVYNNEWLITDFDEDRLELEDNAGNTLVLEQDCEDDSDDLVWILIEDTWIIALYDEAGDNQTDNYNGYVFDFQDNDVVIADNGTPTPGEWSVDDDETVMDLDFEDGSILEEISDDDWLVIDVQVDRVELAIENDNGGINTLVFEKL